MCLLANTASQQAKETRLWWRGSGRPDASGRARALPAAASAKAPAVANLGESSSGSRRSQAKRWNFSSPTGLRRNQFLPHVSARA